MTLQEIWTDAFDEGKRHEDASLKYPLRRASWADPTLVILLAPQSTLIIGKTNGTRLPPNAGKNVATVTHLLFAVPWGASYDDMVATDWEAA